MSWPRPGPGDSPRPNLRLPWRRPAVGPDVSAILESRTRQDEEDALILRRTRLRLMTVSGGLTLVILVILGLAVYSVVETAVVGGSTDRLKRVALQEQNENPGIDIQGASAGLLPIMISPSGQVQVPPRVKVPGGLPNQASLDAVQEQGDIDIRDITAPDGTPYRVISGFVIGQRFSGWKGQWVQNRSSEVDFLNSLKLILVGGGAAALLVALVFGYLYAGRAMVPIRLAMSRRQAALQRQREFTANASHELRTPLTVIRASVEDLRRNKRQRVADVGDALDDIEAEVRHVTALVEDMLYLARTDSGVVQLEMTQLDLADVAAEATSLLGSLGSDRNVTVTLDPYPAQIQGDQLRLRQLVTILVDNAIRHSPPKTTVSVRVRPEAGAALLTVEDQGNGIRAEDLPRLWERFWRADNAPAGGTGLGLAIAKWIVEQHGGTITAENRAEGGARFTVRLPGPKGIAAAPPTPEPTPEPSPEPQTNRG